MKGATLFSGIGAPEAARPDWEWLWAAEIERFPAAVHAQRHGCPNLGDVTADDFCERAAAIGRPDVLVFGSPCQSFSVAGKRLGLDDPRGNLALVALGIAARLRPEWLVFENVPGLLSSGDGRDFGAFLATVEQCGYLGAWRILDAQYFGVPQRRRRVFAVFRLGDWRGPAAVLFEPQSLRGDPPPRREAGQEIANSLTDRPDRGGSNSEGQRLIAEDVAGCLAANMGNGNQFALSGQFVAHVLRADGFDASEDGTGRGTPLVAMCLNAGGMGRQDAESETLIAHAFDARQNGVVQYGDGTGPLDTHGHSIAIAFNLRGREGGSQPEPDELASLRAASGGSSRSYIAQSAVRRLTPRECERLQGFPDDFTAVAYRGKPAADGPRYKSLGNSMAVPVLRWILDRIETVSAITAQAVREAA